MFQSVDTTKKSERTYTGPTYFGKASQLFCFNFLRRTAECFEASNKSFDYFRVEFPNHSDVLTMKVGNEADAPVRSYAVHKFLYGLEKDVNGVKDFHQRIDNEKMWSNHWPFEYSPFRMAQKVLKDYGLYLVNHTFSGDTPFLYVYKYLPKRGVINRKPWHDYANVPALCARDFESVKLSPAQTRTAIANAFNKFSTMCVEEGLSSENLHYRFETEEESNRRFRAMRVAARAEQAVEAATEVAQEPAQAEQAVEAATEVAQEPAQAEQAVEAATEVAQEPVQAEQAMEAATEVAQEPAQAEQAMEAVAEPAPRRRIQQRLWRSQLRQSGQWRLWKSQLRQSRQWRLQRRSGQLS
jgi:hypothetical protein